MRSKCQGMPGKGRVLPRHCQGAWLRVGSDRGKVMGYKVTESAHLLERRGPIKDSAIGDWWEALG